MIKSYRCLGLNYNKIYTNIISNRQKNPYNGYTERHHILPKSLGGSDDKGNLVSLTAREHYICHLLLTKMYFDENSKNKMIHAFFMMCNAKADNQERTYKISSFLYEKYKIDYSLLMSKIQKGELNSQYKTAWINNPSIMECKKVKLPFKLPEGWFIGRVIDWSIHYSQKSCPICNTKGLASKLAKYCSVECKNKYNFENSFVYKNKDIFKLYYIETKSINISLIKMGKVGAGGYYVHALKLIKNDDEMLKIYENR